jgi:hypothetical protein
MILVISVGALALQVHRHPLVSAIDETSNGDYLYRAAGFGMVRQGELLGPDISREIACRGGVENRPHLRVPPCPEPGRQLPASKDQNTADIHPPGYYWVSATGARALMAAGATGSLLPGAADGRAGWPSASR